MSTEEPIGWQAKARELRLRWGWTHDERKPCLWWQKGDDANNRRADAPDYARSVDAILADMPKDWEYSIDCRLHNGKPHVNAYINGNRMVEGHTAEDRKTATVQALLLACLEFYRRQENKEE